MLAKDIKRGHIVNHGGAPCMIETINVQSPSARGALAPSPFLPCRKPLSIPRNSAASL
jgi:hypothetical protein